MVKIMYSLFHILIPYFSNWANACTVQPFVAACDEGALRRAANVLLALQFKISELGIFEMIFNESAFEKLQDYAQKGEIHSTRLRNNLLSMVFLTERVCIRALTTFAREVFRDDKTLIACLLRELIHDRQRMRSRFEAK